MVDGVGFFTVPTHSHAYSSLLFWLAVTDLALCGCGLLGGQAGHHIHKLLLTEWFALSQFERVPYRSIRLLSQGYTQVLGCLNSLPQTFVSHQLIVTNMFLCVCTLTVNAWSKYNRLST